MKEEVNEEALRRLQAVIDINTLGDLTREEFDAHTEVIKDNTLIRRARHAVYETRELLRP